MAITSALTAAEHFPSLKSCDGGFGDRVRFVFRNFPLTEIHSHAELAAEAAEAAAAQDRFWEMHATLFTHQNSLDKSSLLRFASHVGVEIGQFSEALVTRSFQPRVREYYISGVRSGVNGTPTFFINGVRNEGPFDLSSLIEAIEEAAQTQEQ